MKWALVLALVLCCGLTRGEYENESGESVDKLTEQLAQEFLFRARNILAGEVTCGEKECKNGALKCIDEDPTKCECQNATSGEDCSEVTGCINGLQATCDDLSLNCIYDPQTPKKAACECTDNKKFDGESCKETCDSETKNCLDGIECEAKNGYNFCTCVEGLTGDFCQNITDCGSGGRYEKCSTGGGNCTFSVSGSKASCVCETDKQFDTKSGQCRTTCNPSASEPECANGAACEVQDDHNFCTCVSGLTGDRCQEITDCGSGKKYENCTAAKGECKFSGTQAFCDCGTDKQFDTKSSLCRATCDLTKSECANDAKCEVQDGKNFCTCAPGLTGDQCQVIIDCEPGKKYENCTSSDGHCKFSNDGNASCECGAGKQFDTKKGLCRSTCDSNTKKCANGASCDDQGGQNFCTCVEGLIGDLCEVITDCEPSGKYEKCKSGGGNCIFSGGEASCSCGTGKLFDLTDGQCKDACGSVICRNGAQCKSGKCDCPTRLSGDDCGKVEGCTEELEKTCKQISSKCIYDHKRESKASCECKIDNQKFDGEVCKECICGENAECFFDKEKTQQCPCIEKFSKRNGTCEQCDCGEFGTCTFNEGLNKICGCNNQYKENKGICKLCYCGESGICSFDENDKKTCKCNDKFGEKNGTCVDCECGDEVNSCQFNKGVKICNCKSKYADNNGTCSECNCGELETEAKSCKFNNSEKVCDCASMYANKEGKCTACNCGNNTVVEDKGCEFKNDAKFCKCKEKYSQKGDKCEACDCGTYGKCSFDESEKLVCTCIQKYAVKNGKCELCNCGAKGNCSFDGDGKKTCSCSKGFVEDAGTCKECDCGSNGQCSFENKIKKCNCSPGYREKGGKCIETCEEDADCFHKTNCTGTEKSGLFCDCGTKFLGDKCEKVEACETGELHKCEASEGKCSYSFEKSLAVCECSGEKKFDTTLKMCRKKCSSKDNCNNGAECKDDLCVCRTGTSGDDCSKVDDCNEALVEKCEKASASCVYDIDTAKATCICSNDDLMYKDDECTPKWCVPNPCKAVDSKCTYGNGSAFCKCPKDEQYYDYASDKCIDISKCLLNKCKPNEICKEDGTCACDENHVKDNDQCIKKKLCDNNPCYSKANCSEGDTIGTVKCECPPDTYFNQKLKTCEVVKKEEGKCKEQKQCGPFGYCIQVGELSQCACMKDLATRDEKKDVCILNTKKACVTNKTLSDNPNKCDCSGIYKNSNNGITCEVMTCGDKAAQDDCQSKRAFCADTISNQQKIGYECKCPAGQKLIKDKGCVDICSDKEEQKSCSQNQQTCYLNELGEGTCKCPPGFAVKTQDGKVKCVPSAKYEYLLEKLPVIKSEFLNDGSVNKGKLNKYVIQSMKALYKNFEFASVLNYSTSDDSKEVLLCNVWLNFNKDAEKDVKRWRSQIVNKDGSLVLPPSLKLSSEKLDDVKEEKVEFCSDIVRQTACGQGSKCEKEKNVCDCIDGYRVIGPTVQVNEGSTVLRCEDIDECLENTHTCKSNSECSNTIGGYLCKCNPGFHKKDQNESEECVELCSPNPCNDGDCTVKENKVECSCKVGFKGSYCTESDDKLKQAQHSTKVVGAVLGTILAVTFVAIIAYIVKLKKNSYSEDFSSSPRDNSEMAERNRPLRGVSNRGYQ